MKLKLSSLISHTFLFLEFAIISFTLKADATYNNYPIPAHILTLRFIHLNRHSYIGGEIV
jgi:hypothetical protein